MEKPRSKEKDFGSSFKARLEDGRHDREANKRQRSGF